MEKEKKTVLISVDIISVNGHGAVTSINEAACTRTIQSIIIMYVIQIKIRLITKD